jgi:hypothetical protein
MDSAVLDIDALVTVTTNDAASLSHAKDRLCLPRASRIRKVSSHLGFLERQDLCSALTAIASAFAVSGDRSAASAELEQKFESALARWECVAATRPLDLSAFDLTQL